MRSGIVDVLMGSVVHGCFLVRSPVEKQQHEPGPSPICSCFHTILDKWFYYHLLPFHAAALGGWRAEGKVVEFFVDLVPPQTHIWKVTTKIILIFHGVEFWDLGYVLLTEFYFLINITIYREVVSKAGCPAPAYVMAASYCGSLFHVSGE